LPSLVFCSLAPCIQCIGRLAEHESWHLVDSSPSTWFEWWGRVEFIFLSDMSMSALWSECSTSSIEPFILIILAGLLISPEQERAEV
jgi:hypothetical protein